MYSVYSEFPLMKVNGATAKLQIVFLLHFESILVSLHQPAPPCIQEERIGPRVAPSLLPTVKTQCKKDFSRVCDAIRMLVKMTVMSGVPWYILQIMYQLRGCSL